MYSECQITDEALKMSI